MKAFSGRELNSKTLATGCLIPFFLCMRLILHLLQCASFNFTKLKCYIYTIEIFYSIADTPKFACGENGGCDGPTGELGSECSRPTPIPEPTTITITTQPTTMTAQPTTMTTPPNGCRNITCSPEGGYCIPLADGTATCGCRTGFSQVDFKCFGISTFY